MAKLLIVNADDLGLAPAVNDAVARAHVEGIVTSASLMVNMPACRAAVDTVLAQHPALGVGLHVCLTSGKPVLPAAAVPLLVDRDGHFALDFGQLWRLLRSPRSSAARAQIECEMRAQLAKADALGVALDHVNSHQHVHMIPAIHGVLVNLAAERRLPIRVAQERWGAVRHRLRRLPGWLVRGGLLKRALLARCALRSAAQRRDVRYPDHYFGILDSGRMAYSAWLAIAASLADGITEVGVHPACGGAPDDGLVCSGKDRRFIRSAARERELRALVDPRLRRQLQRQHVGLGSFAQAFAIESRPAPRPPAAAPNPASTG